MMAYRVDFWNDEDAEVPTQDAVIVDVLNPEHFDLATFEFTRIGFLDWDMPLPGAQTINERIDPRPDMSIVVDVRATFDPETGEIQWWFQSVDPETGDYPMDPMAGFLPPVDPETMYDIGWVEYRVRAKDDLQTNTRIENQALVQFDFMGPWGEAPPYGPWTNTIDADPPESWVNTLPETSQQPVSLTWTGNAASGIDTFDIYVRKNDSEWQLWKQQTKETSAEFSGELEATYEFYAVSVNNLGVQEKFDPQAEAATRITSPMLWSLVLNVENAAPSSLTIGMTEEEMPDFGHKLDVPANEPESGGYARLKDADFAAEFREDYRGVGGEADYILLVEAGKENDATVSWNVPELPQNRYLSLWETDIEFDDENRIHFIPIGDTAVNMSESTQLTVPQKDVRAYIIRYAENLTFDWHFHAGWNLKSLPLQPENPAVTNLLAKNSPENEDEQDDNPKETRHFGEVWHWDGTQYLKIDYFQPHLGYWIYMQKDQTIMLRGLPLADDQQQLQHSWNLVGFSADQLYSTSINNSGQVYTWEPLTKRYISVTVPLPGVGYWIHAAE